MSSRTLLTVVSSALVAALLCGAAAQQPPPRQDGAYDTEITCTPRSIKFSAGELATQNPIAAALRIAGPGSTILVEEGDYPPFSIGRATGAPNNAITRGGEPYQPLTVEARGRVRILGFGGVVGGAQDAIFVSQERPHGWITFKNIEIVPGSRAAVMFDTTGAVTPHEGYRFIDCDILGTWDHVAKRGQPSKWGVHATGLKDFEFMGTHAPAVVRNIRDEHAFYLHNCQGDVLIQNVQAYNLGRTFVQIVAREREGPPGTGTVTVRNCEVHDACIAEGDAYKGGSAFTVGGRHIGTLVFENNIYRTGLHDDIKALHLEGQPFGTGAFMCIDGDEELRNGTLILRNNDFRMCEDCGDRAVVSIGGCDDVRIEGTNTFVAGAWPVALALDPPALDGSGGTESEPNVELSVDANTFVTGKIEVRGKETTLERLITLGY